MAILGGTILEAVTAILEAPPAPGINSRIWQELVKLQNALKDLASAADLVAAQKAAQGEVPFEQIGTVNAAVHLGNLTTVKVLTLGKHSTGGIPINFIYRDGQLKVTYTTVAGGVDGIAIQATETAAIIDVILKGLYVHPRTVEPASNENKGVGPSHNRLARAAISNPKYNYRIVGKLAWLGYSTNFMEQWYNGYWFVGTRIGYVGAYYAPYADFTTDLAWNALVYFNPRRA